MRPMSMVWLLAVIALFAGTLAGQDRSVATRLTSDAAQEGFPAWSPDGRSFIYSHFSWKDSLGKNGIWKITLDDMQPRQVFSGIAEHPKPSPDGRLIVFDSDTGGSMSMVAADGGSPRKFLPDTIAYTTAGSPAGRPTDRISRSRKVPRGPCVSTM